MRFQVRVAIIIIGVVFIGQVLTLFFLHRLNEKFQSELLRNSLLQTSKVVEQIISAEAHGREIVGSLVSRDYALVSAVGTGNPATISTMLESFRQRMDVSFLAVVSREQKTAYSAPAVSAEELVALCDAYCGKLAEDKSGVSLIEKVSGTPYMLTLVRSNQAGAEIFLLFGNDLTDFVSRTLDGGVVPTYTIVLCRDESCTADGQSMISTVSGLTLDGLVSAMKESGGGDFLINGLAGRGYLSSIFPVVNERGMTELMVFIHRSKKEILGSYESFRAWAALVGVLTTIGMLRLSMSAAHEIGKPVQSLRDAAVAMMKPHQSSVISMRSKDQLGEMAEALSSIGKELADQDKLRYEATHDTLTQVGNRRLLVKKLEEVIEDFRYQRADKVAALFFIDLDGFKPINDAHGHPVGDAVLVQISGRLRDAAGEKGLVARLGGDEFAILLKNISSREEVAMIADRIIVDVKRTVRIDEIDLQLGCSVGIAMFPRGKSLENWLKMADEALYGAKHGGKGRYLFSDAQ